MAAMAKIQTFATILEKYGSPIRKVIAIAATMAAATRSGRFTLLLRLARKFRSA